MKITFALPILILWVAPPVAYRAFCAVGFQLVDSEKQAYCESHWPRSENAWFNSLKARAVFYTEKEMPKAYQDWGGALPGIHSAMNNVSAVRSEPFGNPNREFPWGMPAGLLKSSNFQDFKFVVFPVGLKIRWARIRLESRGEKDRRTTYIWTYPVETTFGEVLQVTDPAGKPWTYEVRTRTRTRDGWRVNVFKPVTSENEYRELTKQEGSRNTVGTLSNAHPVKTFESRAMESELRAINHGMVKQLLKLPFKSALGQEWKEKDGMACHAPTTKASFHIVPRDYKAGYIAIDSKSCMNCHRDVLRHADDFEPRRDWYGRVRGSDGIFSFHIFQKSSISRNGSSKPVRLREELIRAGLLKEWKRGKR